MSIKTKKNNHTSRRSGETILKYDKSEVETSDTNHQDNIDDILKIKNLEKEETNPFNLFNSSDLQFLIGITFGNVIKR